MTSYFCISLDYEKHWGIVDRELGSYSQNIENADFAALNLFNLFECRNIRATWAVVGLLLAENASEVEALLSDCDFLNYHDEKFNPAFMFNKSNKSNENFCSLDTIRKISKSEKQSIISHTFSHLFSCEKGIRVSDVLSDAQKFNNTLKDKLQIESNGIIFPRNQIKQSVISTLSYSYYRSNLDNVFDQSYSNNELNLFVRGLRFIDSILPIKMHDKCLPYLDSSNRLAIPATRFLRPLTKNKVINSLRLKRVKREMLYAAKNKGLFHLWWHPHNFGNNLDANLENLKEIISFYKELNKKYGMKSANMDDLYFSISNSDNKDNV